MLTDLTLRIDDKLIERAKAYAGETGKSLAELVADYLALLTSPREQAQAPRLTPIVSSLVGILEGHDVDEEDYKRHLEEKYR